MKKFLSLLWRGWTKFAHGLGIVNTKILLTLTYFIVIAVVAILTRLFGRDLLDRRIKPRETYWHEHDQEPVTLETCRRQF
jgi:hypothetical protein